ncbi:hypothetical protein BC831DRAFT_460036 [Entophlyctis helioformis]|nr:hypothetical protein BC831DRAFT_460036 [Entophlyctis helioformis]
MAASSWTCFSPKLFIAAFITYFVHRKRLGDCATVVKTSLLLFAVLSIWLLMSSSSSSITSPSSAPLQPPPPANGVPPPTQAANHSSRL